MVLRKSLEIQLNRGRRGAAGRAPGAAWRAGRGAASWRDLAAPVWRSPLGGAPGAARQVLEGLRFLRISKIFFSYTKLFTMNLRGNWGPGRVLGRPRRGPCIFRETLIF